MSGARHVWLPTALALCLAGTIAAVLSSGNASPGFALAALARGAAGSWHAFTSGTLVRATPLLFTGLGVAVAFRAGVFNIGAEGQFLTGAAAAAAASAALSSHAGALTPWLAIVAGALAGAAWASVADALRRRFEVPEVISTILLNFVAIYLVGYLVRGPLQEPTHIYPQTRTLELLARLPRMSSGTRLHWGFPLGVAIAIALAFWLSRTASGFRLRLVGANPHAARVTGRVNVGRVTTLAFLASGALAGAGGAVEVNGVTFALYENISPGYGYTAIAVALLAGLDPRWVIATAVGFGALEAGASAMQRDAGVPSVIAGIVEASIILIAIAWSARSRGDASLERGT
ncbi:MAG: putative transporter permease protein [Gemmatimonadetes bacterium]|nr:putative transporter permease protein [Gemmatimonadota bacterium]